MKKISKLVLLFLSALCIFACAGCLNKNNSNGNGSNNSAADESGWTNNY